MKKLTTILSRLLQMALIFIISGTCYVTLEIIYRGYSDISMWILAGICGLIIAGVNNNIFLSSKTPFELQVAFCATCCTIGELITGLIVNQDFTIWDYRGLFGTFAYDQLNIFFIIVWIIICALGIPFLDWVEYKLLDGRKPIYKHIYMRKGELS